MTNSFSLVYYDLCIWMISMYGAEIALCYININNNLQLKQIMYLRSTRNSKKNCLELGRCMYKFKVNSIPHGAEQRTVSQSNRNFRARAQESAQRSKPGAVKKNATKEKCRGTSIKRSFAEKMGGTLIFAGGAVFSLSDGCKKVAVFFSLSAQLCGHNFVVAQRASQL
jgi:hypothetical protein